MLALSARSEKRLRATVCDGAVSGGCAVRTHPSFGHFLPLAGRNQLGGIDGFIVHLHFHDFSIFSDQEIDAFRSFILSGVDAVLAGDFPSPIAQQRKGYADLVGKGFIGERAIHAHTHDLGVCCFQLLQVLLEVLHLLGSTTGEGKNIEADHDILLALEVMQRHLL